MKRIIFIIALLLLSSCSGDVNPFFIKASDGVKISANFFPAESEKGVILLHMLNHGKNDWNDFVPVLNENGYNVLAIDMRGHGLSELDWREFSDVEFSRAVLDVAAAKSHLEENGVSEFGIIGASIGANIALKYAAQDKEIKSIILLSPSLNYRGVTTSDNILKYDRAVFTVTSSKDTQSADDAFVLHEVASGEKKFLIYNDAGHGTDMFKEPSLNEVIITWLKKTV
ncbi:alpha/beta fold hydrolase [Candidatus Woesearchaeota archaeon]|nr:alpha/beta fold hydrolase [Candidatus Woesearchaeota archaeon]